LLTEVGATADSVAWAAEQHGWCSTDDVAEGSRRHTCEDDASVLG
jgi:hypothetical protein